MCFDEKNLGRKTLTGQQQKRNKVTHLVFNEIIEYKITGIFKRIWVSNILKSNKEFKTTIEKEYKIHDIQRIVRTELF